MPETVIRLAVITGPHKGRKYCFRGKSHCTVGRAADCLIQLAGRKRDKAVSPHHCEFEVDVPFIRVTDLDSTNGTFINGVELERCDAEKEEYDQCTVESSERILKNGDILRVGTTGIKVDVMNCPPHFEEDGADPPVWKPCEVAKKNCLILC